MNFDFTMQRIRYCINEAGGDWGGLQDAIYPTPPSLIVINPETNNHLAIPFQPATFEDDALTAAILKRLSDDTAAAANRQVSVKVATLLKIAQTLSDTSAELNALCARRKA